MRILLVEDDEMIAQAVSDSLREIGYVVDWVDNGKTAEPALVAQAYDLLLLDLGLPQRDGLSLLKQIRMQKNDIPILILTARDDIASRLAGLDSGADDYLVKPFDLAELQARMRAVLRRHHKQTQTELTNEALKLNLQSYQVEILAERRNLALTHKEFVILQALMLRAGVILSRSELEDKLYGWGEEVESNAVDFLIHALRKKIGKQHIKNVRGVGWLVEK